MRNEEWYSAIQDYLDKKMGKEEDKNKEFKLKSFFASHFGISTKNIMIKKHSNKTNEKKESE